MNVSVPFADGNTTFSNVSFFLPTGSVVTSATMQIILPTTPIVGTAFVSIASQVFPPPDFSVGSLHIPATFNNVATMTDYPQEVIVANTTIQLSSFPTTPIISGNEVSTGTWDLTFITFGDIAATVDTQGYNWAGWITGRGQADIPYSVQVDVDYTVAPEPPSFVLLGTAMLGLLGVARRKCSAS